MRLSKIAERVRDALPDRLVSATIQGDGYEALVTRNGIVVGRVYVGTIEEIENDGR